MALSPEDPHSFSRPELARVTDTRLELYVDFGRRVLHGKVILSVQKKYLVTNIILDNYELVIKNVTNPATGESLNYLVGPHYTIGSSLTIQLPETNIDIDLTCEIQIEYETSPNSPALYWLTPLQTADGKYPFLLSKNKQTYARAVFPCQDTPSVKFPYTAKISVPKNFTVIMSALLQNKFINTKSDYKYEYEFIQAKPISSYAVVIVVGSLKKRRLSVRSNVFAEKTFIDASADTFSSGIIENMLEIAENLCGPYFWDRFDICVLPPSIGNFESEIECPCITFMSPILIHGDHTAICTFARNIAQSWAGSLVTCANYNDFWLHKSFSMFICRKIICKVWTYKDALSFLRKLALNDLTTLREQLNNSGLLKCLLPDLKGLLPNNVTKCVPYEEGCVLLYYLEEVLGGSSVFEPFFKSYFFKFAYKSIKTDDWLQYLYDYFPDKEKLRHIDWNSWFQTKSFELQNYDMTMTSLEQECHLLAQIWASWNNTVIQMPLVLYKKNDLCDNRKIIFLNQLHVLHKQLNVEKMQFLLNVHSFETKSYQIRFLWLLLCIKVRWQKKIPEALDFSIQFCMPTFASHIFQHLLEYSPECYSLLVETFLKNKEKMLHTTQDKLKSILHLQ